MRTMAASRYREEFLLGTGGMAEVWRASGPLGVVAIKRLLPHAARNPSLAAAFEREGRLLQRIVHPNVIGIHEIAHDERGTSLVLEYVDGSDLRGLGGHPVPEQVALRVIRDVLRALQAVHGLADEETGRPLGLIHRDLSPSNVLVGVDGRVKLTDFGIARAVSGSHATTGQNIKGTLAYLSPEQATGAPVDARADLFAVGALLYEMLCGAPIYDDDDPRLALARARAGDVHSLGLARPETAPPIVELVDRALAAAPTDRFPNAAMMLAELERVAEQTCGLASDEDLAAWSRAASIAAGRGEGATLAASSTTVVLNTRRSAQAAVVLGTLLAAGALWFVLRSRAVKNGAGAGDVAPPSQAAAARETAMAPPATTEIALQPPASGSPPADGLVSGRSGSPPADGLVSGRSGSPPADDRPVGRPRVADRGRRAARSEARAPAQGDPRPVPNAGGSETADAKCVLDLGSEPAFAYVTIDGVKAGATPLFGREITPGTHHIQVSREGLGSKSFTIDVRPGDRISRVIKLP